MNQRLIGLLFVSPFVLVMLAFLVTPLAYSLWLSLQRTTLVAGEQFVGLANYAKAFADPEFRRGVLRVLLFGLVQIPIMLGLALLGALILDAVTGRLAKLFRLTLFMPYAVPAVIGALMWGFLFSPNLGPVTGLTEALGLGKVNLLSTDLIMLGLGNVVTWQWTGYNMIVLYAALQGLPREVYEAAALDGAGQVTTALRVKVPMISSALVLAMVFTIIGTLQFFTEPQVLRPIAGTAISGGFTPNVYAYNMAFQYSDFNYSAAISFALGTVVFVGSYAFLFLTRRRSGLR
ncbi:carbohydrate ABC transporter permease [Sphaerisporangium fuscum]|uniref:carbohydrate ABC transporter permease n=1 Tax=Sphaerisporangium fuscum TaxID=2835868 RepID=UPI001BDC7A3A|nr:sugar ABC transporter permease [Sphaerisporangium fuscum]